MVGNKVGSCDGENVGSKVGPKVLRVVQNEISLLDFD